MNVPLEFSALREAGVGCGEKVGGKAWREEGVEVGIEDVAEDDLVDMEGKGV